nr:nuclear transport factor 2 family protein [Allomuricauda sp.]
MNTKNLTFVLVLFIGLFTSCEYIDYDWDNDPPKNRRTVEQDYRELVENEFTFAQLTSSTSIKEGFLSFLAEDGIIFRGDFVIGKAFYEPQEPTSDILSWKPVFADISRSGDFGYTTGPFEIRTSEASVEPDGYGEYVSIWEGKPDGTWKVAFDLGIFYGNSGMSFPDIVFPDNFPLKVNIDWDKEKLRNELIEVDAFFGTISATENLKNAYDRFLAEDTRLLRNGSIPFATPEEVNMLVNDATQKPTFELVDADVSKIGDMGYTFGFTDLEGLRRPYLHIWKFKKFTGWRLALEMSFLPVTYST